MKKDPNQILLNPHADLSERLIDDWNELLAICLELKQQGKRIILTAGTWDLLHIGHSRYMRKAKELGDVLIVAVDSDEFVKVRKGPTRPIQSESERIELVSELRSVDFVTFVHSGEEKGPERLVRMLRPDVLVLSSTTTNERADFAAHWKKQYEGVCQVEILEPQAITSTSNQIRLLALEGTYDSIKKLLTFLQQNFPHEFEKATNNGNN